MALTAPLVEPLPLAPKNFRAIIFVVHATPLVPMPLFPTAPIVPATWVPWPLSSVGFPSLLTKS